MRRLPVLTRAASLLMIVTCAPRRSVSPAGPLPGRVDVRVVSDEADAALAVLHARLHEKGVVQANWDRLLASEGYQHLEERETSMRRPFADSAFKRFLMSDTMLQRAPVLELVLPPLERVDVSDAAARALAYLPAGTRLHARLYLEIKPTTNSFVFTGRDSIPSIFLNVQPNKSPAQLLNTLAHELHHIGLNAACPQPRLAHVSPAQRMLLLYLGAFGEGQAMLAAAGSPSVHPHAEDDDTIRARWDRDVANAPADVEELSRFFASVLDGGVTSADSVEEQGRTYFGVQGPWYTVGWLMASTIERERGRDALVGSLCEPTQFIALYNDAARAENARTRSHPLGAALPIWNAVLLNRLEILRKAAG